MNFGELGNAFMFAAVSDMFVNLIGYHIYLRMFGQNSGQTCQFFFGINRTGGI